MFCKLGQIATGVNKRPSGYTGQEASNHEVNLQGNSHRAILGYLTS